MLRRLLLVFSLLSLVGCWGGYASRTAIHAELLSSMANKLVSLVEAGRPPAVESMGEYIYPAKRAEEFLESYASYAEYASYQTLKQMVPRYRELVRRIDAGRAAGIEWSGEMAALRAEETELRRLAAEVANSLSHKR
jgi:hypothetical protein